MPTNEHGGPIGVPRGGVRPVVLVSVIDDSPRSADEITNTTVVVGATWKSTFGQLLLMNKRRAWGVLSTFVRTLSEGLRETNEKSRASVSLAGKF